MSAAWTAVCGWGRSVVQSDATMTSTAVRGPARENDPDCARWEMRPANPATQPRPPLVGFVAAGPVIPARHQSTTVGSEWR